MIGKAEEGGALVMRRLTTTPPIGTLARRRQAASFAGRSKADFETVLAALENDAEEAARDEAQDVLQSRAPRRWLEDLESREPLR